MVPFYRYQWLNDDQHGVGRTAVKATVLPNGCALGATWDPALIRAAGAAIATEARAVHRLYLSQNDRGAKCNGCGVTLYAPVGGGAAAHWTLLDGLT